MDPRTVNLDGRWATGGRSVSTYRVVGNMNISVVIPTFNRADLVGRALQGVVSQTYKPTEILVIDDGSTDETEDVVRRFGSRVRYVHQPNAGVSAARNRGIEQTTGDWIALLDSDDEWLPHKLESQTQLLEANPHLKWCGCNLEYVRNGLATAGSVIGDLKLLLDADGQVRYFQGELKGLPFQTSGFVINRAVISEVGGFDPGLRINEDRDLWWRIAMRYPLLGYCPEVCHRHYVDVPGSLTKGDENRTIVLENICENMRRAQAAGPGTANAFYPVARTLAWNYLLRAAGGRAEIDPTITNEATELFPPTLRERIIRSCLARLPASLAGKVVDHLSL